MKKILFTAALVGLCSVAASAAATPQTFVYISNAASGTISAWALDKHSQTMQPVATYPAAKQVMSSVVSPDKKLCTQLSAASLIG